MRPMLREGPINLKSKDFIQTLKRDTTKYIFTFVDEYPSPFWTNLDGYKYPEKLSTICSGKTPIEFHKNINGQILYISMEYYMKYINSYLIDHNVPFRVITTLSLKLDTRLEDEFIFIANNPMTFKEFVDCFELYWSPFDSFMFNTINVLRVHKIVT